MSRRRIAPLIRVRQELWKRAERVLPDARWEGAGDTMGVIDPDVRASLPSSDASDPLRALGAHLREQARSRYPLTHLFARDRSTLADAAEVVRDAERLVRGEWDVLGKPVRVSAATIDWRAHPLSSVSTPARHFSRVSYAADVLGGDVKYLWELNRHAEVLRLAQAYWLTRRPEFAETATALLDSWMDQNPPGRGINWISCVDVAFRSIAWCWAWQLTAESDAWTGERIGRLLWWMERAARFIGRYDSVHHSPNTHLTGEALGLVYIGTVFPELRGARRWRALGIRILTEESSTQFLADGMHYERCTGYHRYHLEFYLHALALAKAAGESWADPFAGHLSRGADVSVHLRRPDGTWPVLGDEDAGWAVRLGTREVTDQSELLVVAARLLGRPELQSATAPSATALAWWMLGESAWHASPEAPAAVSPVPTSASFRIAGYYTARDDWSERAWYCAVDAGPHGGTATGHAHTDLGHVEIAQGRQWITADPGCPVYTSEPARRNWFRGQRAHASVMIDDVELATPAAAAFRWDTIAPTPSVDVADRGAYWYCRLAYDYETHRGTVRHERQVVLVRGSGVIVCDMLVGDGPREIAVRWPLAVTADDAVIAHGGSTLSTGDCAIGWATTSDAEVAAIEATRRSPKFGDERDACALVLALHAAALPCWIVTSFTPAASGAPPVAHAVGDSVEATVARPGVVGPARVVFRRGAAPQLLEGAADGNEPRVATPRASAASRGGSVD